ncbi:MAG: hypothetical protein IT372_00120 [Polyangiaceae bacterium]|nr:hypothetical protein [Polyangiaceae bacterium]
MIPRAIRLRSGWLHGRELAWRTVAAALLFLAGQCGSWGGVCLWAPVLRAARRARRRADDLLSVRRMRALLAELATDAAPSSRRPVALAELGVGRAEAFDAARRAR